MWCLPRSPRRGWRSTSPGARRSWWGRDAGTRWRPAPRRALQAKARTRLSGAGDSRTGGWGQPLKLLAPPSGARRVVAAGLRPCWCSQPARGALGTFGNAVLVLPGPEFTPNPGVWGWALTQRGKLLVQGQAGLQPRPQQLHRQLHVAGTQRVVGGDRVLGDEGTSHQGCSVAGTGASRSPGLSGGQDGMQPSPDRPRSPASSVWDPVK